MQGEESVVDNNNLASGSFLALVVFDGFKQKARPIEKRDRDEEKWRCHLCQEKQIIRR
jgi:hypothetical protein